MANKVHKHRLQHHAPSHITMHPYISSCKPNLWRYLLQLQIIFTGKSNICRDVKTEKR